MIKVKPIDVETIDSWPVPESGLPQRAVTACARAGIETVGLLRKKTRRGSSGIKGMGSESVRIINQFLGTCSRIISGRKTFRNLRAIFNFLLPPTYYEILALRYNLHGGKSGPMTLDAISRQRGVTRERIRQLEKRAISGLSSRLAQACLSGSYDLWESFIRNTNGLLPETEARGIKGVPSLEGYDPYGLLLLLCHCGKRITHHNGFFTTLSASTIDNIRKRGIDLIKSQDTARTPAEISRLIASDVGETHPPVDKQAILAILSNLQGTQKTIDGRFFAGRKCPERLVADIMFRIPSPARFRVILREFNQLMQPGSRVGSGSMLRLLANTKRFRKVSSGCYELAVRT